jgi:hypothetical protein
MRIYFLLLFFYGIQSVVSGQGMLGVINSNYAGVYGINLNPAGMVISRLYMDFNLLSFQSSFGNNYAYVERKDYYDYLFKEILPLYYTSENEERNYTIYRNVSNYDGQIYQWTTGPGAMIVDGKHAYGITTGFRTNVSFHNMPKDMGIFLYEAIDYDPQHGITYTHNDKIQVGALTWFEIGLSYAYNFRRYKWESWSAGITLKPLLGIAATYATIDQLTYQVHNDTMATVYNTSFNYAYSIPMDYDNNHFPQSPLIRGFGLGFCLGINYTKTTKGHSTKHYSRLCEQPYEDYNYKIGFSVLDIGYIRFGKNAHRTSYINTNTEWFKPYDTLPDNSVNEINAKVDYYFLDNAEEVIRNEKFTMNIPPALSFQYDYAVEKYLFVNGTVIWGFHLGDAYIKRPSILAFTPRFENPRLEVTLPISFYNWKWTKPRIGFSVRYGNFFLGFDKINTFIGLGDFDGYDVYVGLRLNLTNNFRMNYLKGNCGNLKQKNIEMFDFRNF